MDRVIALIDMDCFYVQVEQKLQPEYWGKPCVMAQYNPYKGGGIIAVNYEARSFGIRRGMRGDEAKELCPDLQVFMVDEKRGKANLQKFRAASKEVMNVLNSFDPQVVVERASIDESYLDLTKYIETHLPEPLIEDLPDTYVAGILKDEPYKDLNEAKKKSLQFFFEQLRSNTEDNDLLMGAFVVKKIRDKIFNQTQFKCSAGISRNKLLAKVSSVLNKPNAQTILPLSSTPFIFRTLPLKKVPSLGGKLGEEIRKIFKIEFMGQLAELSESTLAQHFNNKTCQWVINISKGLEDKPVISRSIPKSIGCGKNFTGVGKNALISSNQVSFWILQLAQELVERLNQDEKANIRKAKLLTVSIRFIEKGLITKSVPLYDINAEKITEDVKRHVISKYTSNDGLITDSVVMLSLMAAKFDDVNTCVKLSKLDKYFSKIEKSKDEQDNNVLSANEFLNIPKITFTDTSDKVGCNLINESVTSNNTQESLFVTESFNSDIFSNKLECKLTAKRGFFYRKTLELMKNKKK